MNPLLKYLSCFADMTTMKELDRAVEIVQEQKVELEKLKHQLYLSKRPIQNTDALLHALKKHVAPGQTLTLNIPLSTNGTLPDQVHFEQVGATYVVDTTELIMKATAAGIQIKLV